MWRKIDPKFVIPIISSRYLTQGLPAVLFSLTPLVLHGFLLKGQMHLLARVPFWLGVWLVGVHSLLAHKEFRFIFPVVPISVMYAGTSESHDSQLTAVSSTISREKCSQVA